MDTDFITYTKTDDIIKTMQKMLKLDVILQVMHYIDHSLKEKIKK